MRSVNKVILVGNLTRDPEMRKTVGGQMIATFGLATNREWMGTSGEKKSLPEFHNLVAWGRLAELCVELLKKGGLVYVEGYLKTRSWDHESGTKLHRTEIVVMDMILLNRDSRGKITAAPEDQITNGATTSEVEATGETPSETASFEDDDFFSELPKSGTEPETENN